MKKIISIMLTLLLAIPSMMVVSGAEPSGQGRYIVAFGQNENLQNASEHARGRGLEVVSELGIINALVINGSLNSIKSLSRDHQLSYIEPDLEVHALAVDERTKASAKPAPTQPPAQPSQSIASGIYAVNSDDAWNQALTGSGVNVAVIDTGIDKNHPDLSDKIDGGISYVPRVTSFNDDNGHGTHVAGIIAAKRNTIGVVGVAPDARLYSVKVLDKRGSGSLSSVISGIQWTVGTRTDSDAKNDIEVINLSLGSTYDSTSMHDALIAAVSKGIIPVAAAGNDGGAVNYPAAYDDAVIAVGAVNILNDSYDFVQATFSSFGNQLDVSAPGVNIYSTYMGGTYKYLSGTSMAAPHVAGAAAIYSQRYLDAATFAGFKDYLASSSRDDANYVGWDKYYGYGLLDLSGIIQQ